MSAFGFLQTHGSTNHLVPPGWALVLFFVLPALPLVAQDNDVLLIDRLPFDRITLNAENDNAVIDVVLLEPATRQITDPLSQTGQLEIRRLSQPSIRYQVQWESIAEVQLYEEMILAEAIRFTTAGNSLGAYRSLQFLHVHYPELRGLAEAIEQYVKREALDAFSAGKYDESLAVLLSLYDINPEHRGLADAVQTVSDRVIQSHLSNRDYSAARGVLELLKQSFSRLELRNIASWESKFQEGAARQVQSARRAIAEGEYDQARVALRQASAILPGVSGTRELMLELKRRSPQIVIGVNQLVADMRTGNDLSWARSRVAQLTDPPLVNMVGFGTEGGIYRSRWASLDSDDTGMQMDVTLDPNALLHGLSPEIVALQLIVLSDPGSQHSHEDLAALFETVAIQDGSQVSVRWRHPHVRPEALLRLSLVDLIVGDRPSGVYLSTEDPENRQIMKYRIQPAGDSSDNLPTVIERVFGNEEEAIAALVEGEIDVLDQVAPWQVDRLRAHPQIAVEQYRLPIIHVLQLNYRKRLFHRREFRRALCYGIDRQRIVKDVLAGRENQAGIQVLSGPLPAGVSVTDPVGYAYNQQLAPRPYEPRLSAVLASVARNTLAKSNEREKEQTSGGEQQLAETETQPLMLAYPPDSVARTCCQTIKLQLSAIGIPIELVELPSTTSEKFPEYDLLYTELVIREPLVDARRLLGPRGSAGICSSSMNLALQQVDEARNWREARDRLRDVHQVAYYDLPVIPLWQTLESLAHRKSLQGIDKSPVTLYQHVTEWRNTGEGAAR